MKPRRPSYASVAATLALVIAIGGGSAIALTVRKARQANNADKVDGVHAKRIGYARDAKPVTQIPPYKRIFRLGGLLIDARCYDMSSNIMDVRVRSGKDDSEVQITLLQSQSNPAHAIDRDFDRGESLELPLGSGGQGAGTIVFSRADRSQVTVDFQADQGAVLGDGQFDCLLGGTALFAPKR